LVQGVGSEAPARWQVHPRYYSPNGYWRAGASAIESPCDSSYIACVLWRVRNSRGRRCASRFHPSVSADLKDYG